MLNPIRHYCFGLSEFWALFDFFHLTICTKLFNLELVICLYMRLNQEFNRGRTLALRGLTIGQQLPYTVYMIIIYNMVFNILQH